MRALANAVIGAPERFRSRESPGHEKAEWANIRGMYPRAPRFALTPVLVLTSGCFVIGQARSQRQEELGTDYAAAYGLTLRLSKTLGSDPAKVTPEALTEAIQAAESCQHTVIGWSCPVQYEQIGSET